MHGWEGETNYVFRTNWQLSKPSMEVVLWVQVVVIFLKRRILFSYNFYVSLVLLLYCVLGLNG